MWIYVFDTNRANINNQKSYWTGCFFLIQNHLYPTCLVLIIDLAFNTVEPNLTDLVLFDIYGLTNLTNNKCT